MLAHPGPSRPELASEVVLEKNFFHCIRTCQQPVANVDLAIRAHTVLCMAEMSERLGLALFFDEKSRTLKTGDGRVVPALSYDSVVPKHEA